MAGDDADDREHDLEQLREDPATWSLDQELDVAAEVYDPRHRNIHELEGEEMLDRFRTLLGFDVSWSSPPDTPPPETAPEPTPDG